jgi:CheY-like chemotaxis protein
MILLNTSIAHKPSHPGPLRFSANYKILYVEDQPIMRNFIKDLFYHHLHQAQPPAEDTFELIETASTQEAKKIIQSSGIAGVITDGTIEAPLDGQEIINAANLHHIPVAILSSDPRPFRDAGFLSNKIDLNQLGDLFNWIITEIKKGRFMS